jgi:hypothetical protein
MFYLCDIIIDNAHSFSQNSIADKQSMQQARGIFANDGVFNSCAKRFGQFIHQT